MPPQESAHAEVKAAYRQLQEALRRYTTALAKLPEMTAQQVRELFEDVRDEALDIIDG